MVILKEFNIQKLYTESTASFILQESRFCFRDNGLLENYVVNKYSKFSESLLKNLALDSIKRGVSSWVYFLFFHLQPSV